MPPSSIPSCQIQPALSSLGCGYGTYRARAREPQARGGTIFGADPGRSRRPLVRPAVCLQLRAAVLWHCWHSHTCVPGWACLRVALAWLAKMGSAMEGGSGLKATEGHCNIERFWCGHISCSMYQLPSRLPPCRCLSQRVGSALQPHFGADSLTLTIQVGWHCVACRLHLRTESHVSMAVPGPRSQDPTII
jgi:hypothetical protein